MGNAEIRAVSKPERVEIFQVRFAEERETVQAIVERLEDWLRAKGAVAVDIEGSELFNNSITSPRHRVAISLSVRFEDQEETLYFRLDLGTCLTFHPDWSSNGTPWTQQLTIHTAKQIRDAYNIESGVLL